uniref:Uncharacterized protein n=1 Tax=uncultured Candidatus Melainabacteria bacterium TaxID=2682970 RepID=A0A650EJE1_9BACT|nr:hypothetical protein Melaina855_0430 [uncultured Candidatus Melainabacteria bacterium]
MDKRQILTIMILIGLISTSIFLNLKSSKNLPFETLIKEVTKNTQLIDLNTDHNQVLDVSQYAKKNKIKIPEVLVNFDTHSDIYLNYPVIKEGSAGVENWINEFIAKNPSVKEVYWVMPIEEARDLNLQTLFAENDLHLIPRGKATPLYGNSMNQNIRWLHFVFNPLFKELFTQEFLIDTNTGLLNEIPQDEKLKKFLFNQNNQYKQIKIITCTEKTLPDLKDKKVFLSIDADYSSNSGFDTVEKFKFIKNQKEIEQVFYSIFKTAKEKNLQPEIITLSLSPQYLPEKHHEFIAKIFYYILQISGKNDLIYTYLHEYDNDPNYLEKKYGKY